MRKQVTFILRLWTDPQHAPSSWEGQVECVADGERAHVRGGEELLRFVETHVARAAPCAEKVIEKKGGKP